MRGPGSTVVFPGPLLSWRKTPLPVWYHEAYRLPLSALESVRSLDPRRADSAAFYLLESRTVERALFRRPAPISYVDLGRVHSEALLESLAEPATLARIFAVDVLEVAVDEVMHTVRLACGGTLAAAREALERRGPTLNLLGGFHHAAPDRASSLCPVNDVAVALAVLRSDGFSGRTVVLDLDAHPPDGTAACLRRDERTWIGSLSGSDWGALDRVDETVLPPRTDDEPYLAALGALLSRMPPPDLAFVLAGGDVLAGDRLGQLGLTMRGVRERDLRVAAALAGVPCVWLPAGGYHAAAWRVLAGTGLALARRTRRRIPDSFDPLGARFAAIAHELSPSALTGAGDEERGGDSWGLTEADLDGAVGLRPAAARHLLGFYTAAGLEYGFVRYGLLPHLERLGYGAFRIELDQDVAGDRLRLHGTANGHEHLLVECVVERRPQGGQQVLFVHWLTLRNPRAAFSDHRPQLPGQEVPGLGLAREADEMLLRMAERLGLAGVSFEPAQFHVAVVASPRYRFVDPRRQGRFEALTRDLAHLPLPEATAAVAAGRVRLLRGEESGAGAPYLWEPAEMVNWVETPAEDAAACAAERDEVRFVVTP